MRWLVAAALVLALAPAALGARGEELYAAECSECHGSAGAGIAGRGPSLRDAGAQAADFYLRTGYMPLADPAAQPRRGEPSFDEAELRALVGYVASLGDGPPVPEPHPERGSLAEGRRLFAQNCAGCHQVAARGGYLTGAVAPALDEATATQIAQAVRIGPYLMPRFPERAIDDGELDSLVAYVQHARDPGDPGGWALGRLGPVPEGMVAWLLAGSAVVGFCVVIGRRVRA